MGEYIKREPKNGSEYPAKITIEGREYIPVVRCKDCKWWNGEQCLARKIEVVDVYDYCSYGERKNDECE